MGAIPCFLGSSNASYFYFIIIMWGGLIRAALPSVLSWGAKTFANSGIGRKLLPVLSTSVGDVFGGAAKFMRNYL